jgi:hypothetical protein
MLFAKIPDPLGNAFFFFGRAWNGIQVGKELPGSRGGELANLIGHGALKIELKSKKCGTP